MRDHSIFGNRRGAGVSLAQVQAKIGHSSPEIHRHYPKYLTTTHCLASAFAESFTPVVLNSEQQELVDSIVTHFGVEEWLDIEMREVSPAIQRLFLLLRALVKRPALIILDEPFAGFDEPMIQRARTYIDSLDSAIIFVTHFEEEVPESIDRVLRLQKGKVIEYS